MQCCKKWGAAPIQGITMEYQKKRAIDLLRLAASWVEKLEEEQACLPLIEDINCVVPNTSGPYPNVSPEELAKDMKFVAMRLEHPSYVSIIEGIGGWNAAFFAWCEDMNGYDIIQTGLNNTLGNGTKESAIGEAKSWAEDEGVEYKGVK